jgi:hypothetical protein
MGFPVILSPTPLGLSVLHKPAFPLHLFQLRNVDDLDLGNPAFGGWPDRIGHDKLRRLRWVARGFCGRVIPFCPTPWDGAGVWTFDGHTMPSIVAYVFTYFNS